MPEEEINNATKNTSGLRPLILALESLEQSKDMVFRFGTSGKISYANKATSDQLGYTHEELISMSIIDIDTELTEEILAQMWGEIRRLRSDVLERTYKRKDGTLLSVEAAAHYVKFEGKEHVNVFVKNIEERKAAEAQLEKIQKGLKESEERYRNSIETALDGVIQFDLTGKITYVNNALAEMTGYSEEELVGSTEGLHIHPDSAPMMRETVKKIALGKPQIGEFKFIHKNNKVRSFSFSGSPLKKAGQTVGITAFVKDITESKIAEEALRKSEARFKQVADNAKEWIWEVDKEGKYTYASPVIEQIAGYKPEEIVGKKYFYDFFPEDQRAALKEGAFKVFASKEPFDNFINELVTKDKKIITVETSGTPVLSDKNELLGYRGLDVDVTERRRAEKALKESEEKYRNITENSSDGIYQVDLSGKIIYANEANAKMFGYTVEEFVGKNFSGLIAKESLPQAEEEFKKNLAGGLTGGEMQAIQRDGSIITISYSGTPLKKEGKIIGVTGVSRDITKKKESERSLRLVREELERTNVELEERQRAVLNVLEDIQEEKKSTEKIARDLEKFELAVENATDHIIITDPDAKVIYTNRAAEELTGFSKEEILGQNPRLWGKQMSLEYYKKLWKTIKVDKKPFIGEIINKNKKGERYEAALRISPVLNKKGDVIFFVGLERDITAQKKAERSKTEFVSLASHQLQTPLTSVRWNAELILDSNEKNHNLTPKQLEYAKDLYNSTVRTIELVNSLLNVSRIELGTINVDPEPTDIKSICISCSGEIQKEAFNKNIKIETFYDPDLPLINVDPIFFRMILSNLLSNAVKYTNPGGSVKLEAIKEEKSIIIKISDTGVGIPKKQQSKIYTKFFRADNAQILSEGSGLGLYIVKSVLERTGGKIWFESEEDKGTTFFIELPLSGMKKLKGTKGFSFT